MEYICCFHALTFAWSQGTQNYQVDWSLLNISVNVNALIKTGL